MKERLKQGFKGKLYSVYQRKLWLFVKIWAEDNCHWVKNCASHAVSAGSCICVMVS
jgi:hypothetical protein